MIRGLNGFRALAFLAVFVFDLFDGFGYLGVQAFFVLSGFLITEILVRMKESRPRRAYFLDFYGRRSVRIFPLYYAYVVIVSLAIIAAGNREFAKLLPWAFSYTLNLRGVFSGFDRVGSGRYLSHLWSLSVEEQFYLVWPLFLYLVPARRLKSSLLVVIALGPVLRWLEYVAVQRLPLPWDDQWELIVYTLPFGYLDAFATGGFFALFASARFCNVKYIVPAFVAAIALGVATEYLSTGAVFKGALGYPGLMKDSYKFIWGYSLFNLLFAMSLVAIRNRALFPRFFEHGWLVYLGKISYGLYVYNGAILLFLLRSLPELSRSKLALLGLPLVIAVASLSYRFFESPFLALKERWFNHAR